MPTSIVASLRDGAGNLMGRDTVRVQLFDPTVEIAGPIEGYTIINDSGQGTPGRDIIFAPPGTSEIHAGDGDDIIVTREEDQVIYAGAGEDRVFASWRGHKAIYLGELGGTASAGQRGEDGAERVELLDNRPFTLEQVLRVYGLMYGENDPWLTQFLELGGRIEAVEGDGNPFTESDWDCVENAQGNLKPVVQVQFSLDSPIEAATHVRRQILDACERSLLGRCDLGYQMEAALVGQLFESALKQEHATFEDRLLTYGQLRTAAFNNAVAATAAISGVYLSSIGFFSEGADLVLTLNDLAGGEYASAIALLPFVSSPMITGAKVTLRRTLDSAELVEKTGEVVRHFPCDLRANCGLGWIPRPEMPVRFRTPPGGGRSVEILGTGQWTNGDNGAAHAAKCESVANSLVDVGGFKYILMNRSLRTCTGLDTLGSFAGKRPDVFGVKLGPDGNPIIFVREIQSPSQTDEVMEQNVNAIRQALESLGFDVNADWIPLSSYQ